MHGERFPSAALLAQAPDINPAVLKMALGAMQRVSDLGINARLDRLLLIDYTKPSTEPRFWVFDLNAGKVLFRELVAHGKNTGGNMAVRFSNTPGSLMSSLGVFLTANTYFGKHGYSLRLRGLEEGINDKSMERAIVLHPASYVSEAIVAKLGRLGRSWGCPAVRPEIARQLIDAVRDGAVLFAYYPDEKWLRSSRFISEDLYASAD
ncbi:MAG: murein L,D-transpeptidase catalytic domain family protein [Bryobacteraceae bacterium]|nr:murein L,D-transpeptidase catalytic domain family protein [Bryobacteraceae bacterium]